MSRRLVTILNEALRQPRFFAFRRLGPFSLKARAGSRPSHQGYVRCAYPFPLFVALQLPLCPMVVLAARIENALDVTVQRPHEADAREHRRAVMFGD